MNVQEVLEISKQRRTKQKDAIEKIIENVHKKIKYYAVLKRESCTYTIPPIINDLPLYDTVSIAKEVFKKLDSEGYICTVYSNGTLDICWNEKLVEQKIKTDSYVLSREEHKLRNITKKIKNVDQRFSFLANPVKVKTELTVDEEIDLQLEKILKEKEHKQNKFKNIIGNFKK